MRNPPEPVYSPRMDKYLASNRYTALGRSMQGHAFSKVERESLDSLVEKGLLTELMLALLLSPSDAAEMSRNISSRDASKILLKDGSRAPIYPGNFSSLNVAWYEAMKLTLSEWVMWNSSAYEALRDLGNWDRRMGVWCACKVAEEGLEYIRDDHELAEASLAETRSWVFDPGSTVRVKSAANAAYARRPYETSWPDHRKSAAIAAVKAVYGAAEAVFGDPDHAGDAAYEVASARALAAGNSVNSAAWKQKLDEELSDLRKVVADACLAYPR